MWINHSVKVIILFLLGYTLYREIWVQADAGSIWEAFLEGVSAEQWYLALTVLSLMPLNLYIEALKWQTLMKPFRKISLPNALRGTLAGITLSLFTPNRVGEYGGRMLMVEARDNWAALISTAAGNFCQLVVLLSTGMAGCFYFCSLYFPGLVSQARILTFFISLLLLMMALVLFHLDRLAVWVDRHISGNDWIKWALERAMLLKNMDRLTLSKGLGLAAIRYFIYSGQYYLLLLFFGVQVPPAAAFAGIATIFFIQTGVPLPPLMGLLARGEIALLIWGNFSANELSILAATFSLFIINLATPALLGMFFVVKTNVLNSFGYEKNSA